MVRQKVQLNKLQENRKHHPISCWPQNYLQPTIYSSGRGRHSKREEIWPRKDGGYFQAIESKDQNNQPTVRSSSSMNSLTGKKCSRNLIEPVLPDCSASIPLCLGLSTLPSLCSKQCQARPHRAHQIQCCGQALFKDLEVDFTKIGPNRRN